MPFMRACRATLLSLALALPVPGGVALRPAAAEDASKVLMENGFRDDFDNLDEGRWYVSDGWTNGRHQDCTWSRRAVRAQGGMLRLSHLPGAGDNPAPLCGEIQTRDFLQYGTIEARIRTPRGSGKNAAVFTYAGPVHHSPHDEIDIEVLTRDPGKVAFNTFVDGKPAQGKTVPVRPPLDRAFHTLAMQWRPDGVSWFIDGVPVHRTAAGATLPDHPQKLFLSFWSTTTLTDWMGKPDPASGPLEFDIDWIAWTPLGAPCLFPESLACPH